MDQSHRATQKTVGDAADQAAKALGEWPKFGDTIAGSRWFNGAPSVSVSGGEVVWNCPSTGCNGHMRFNGSVWATGSPGYHHTCTNCGFTAALKGAVFGEPDDE